MKFLVVVATFCFVAFQNTQATPAVLQEDLDLLIDITVIIKDGLRLIVQGLNASIDVVEKLNDDYHQNATSVIEDVDEFLLNIGNKAFNASIKVIGKLLDLLENDLNAAGKKSVECVKKQKENVNQLIDDVMTNIVKCLSADIIDIVASSQAVLESVKTTRNILSKTQIDLEECDIGVLCLTLLPVDLQDLPDQLLDNLKTAWPLIKDIFKVVTNDVPPCVKKDFEDFRAKLIKIVDATADCVVE